MDLAEMGTVVMYVPGGCTGVAQPHSRATCVRYIQRSTPESHFLKRRKPGVRMHERALCVINEISPSIVKKSFHKAGPFVPFGPAADAGDQDNAEAPCNGTRGETLYQCVV